MKLWFTVEDVSRGADVFLTWLNRVAPEKGTYSNYFLTILQGQKETFVNMVSKALNLQHEEAAAEGTFSAPSPLVFADLAKVFPGITEDEVKNLSDKEARALIAVHGYCKA